MKIKLHNNLDKKIWDNTNNICPVVRDMLLSIAWAYIDYVRNEYEINITNSDIKDILVFGSTTQLFYDKQSDIDVCIVLDMDHIKQQHPTINIDRMLKLYYYDWAMVHICKIYGRKIDLNFQDVTTPVFETQYRRGPNYSILQNKWLFKPITFSKSEISDIESQANDVYKQIFKDYKTVKRNGFKLDEIKQFYNNIIASKKQSVEDGQIINPVYMAIRQFKHRGYIKKLHDIAVQKETDKFVLK